MWLDTLCYYTFGEAKHPNHDIPETSPQTSPSKDLPPSSSSSISISTEITSPPTLPQQTNDPWDNRHAQIIQRQAMALENLESEVKVLTAELQQLREQFRLPSENEHVDRAGVLVGLLEKGINTSRNAHLLRERDAELKVLKLELFNVKEEKKFMANQVAEMKRVVGFLQHETEGHRSEVEKQRLALEQLRRENAELRISLSVNQETNASMQALISSLLIQNGEMIEKNHHTRSLSAHTAPTTNNSLHKENVVTFHV